MKKEQTTQLPCILTSESRADQSAVLREIPIPVYEKSLLTLEEASAYYNIGVRKLRDLTNDERCPYVLWNGSKRLIKRKPFEEYLYSLYSI